MFITCMGSPFYNTSTSILAPIQNHNGVLFTRVCISVVTPSQLQFRATSRDLLDTEYLFSYVGAERERESVELC